MFGIGAGEFILILVVGLIVFGPSKLPEVGRSLGKAIREFRKAQAVLSNALADTEALITSTTPPQKNPPVENKTAEPPRATVNDVNAMINANPINTVGNIKISTAPAELPVEKINLSKTDAVKES